MRLARPIPVFLALVMLIAQVAPAMASQGAPAAAEEETVTDATIDFPSGMSFATRVDIPDGASVDAVQFLYRIGSDQTLNLEIMSGDEYDVFDGAVEIDAFVDLLSSFVPVGVELRFSWEILFDNGDVLSTAEETTQWMDNRFDWEMRSTDQVRLYTYDTSGDFADKMLAESQATIDDLIDRYSIEGIFPITIWVYPNGEDFAGTRQGNSREAIAGITYPGLDTIIGIIPDGDEREFDRVIPHEISHQVLFAATDNPYNAPPLWFDEGIATHTQTGGTEHYAQMVRNAHEQGRLFDIRSLEVSFPYQPQQATLAYASSWSMISYIEASWGTEGIARLIDAFALGLPADEAVLTALDVSMDDLDAGWKAWIATQGTGSRPAA